MAGGSFWRHFHSDLSIILKFALKRAADKGVRVEYIRAFRIPCHLHSMASSSRRIPARRASPAKPGLNECGVTSSTKFRAINSSSGNAANSDSRN